MKNPKFRRPWDDRKDAGLTLSELVLVEVRNAPAYSAGELESLRAMVDKQTEIIVALSTMLAEPWQTELASKFGWKPAE